MPFSPPKPDEIEQAGFTPPSPDDVLDPLDKPFGPRGVTTSPKIRTPIPLGPTPPVQPGVMARAADALETVGNFPGRMLRGVYNAGSELTHAYPPLQPGDSLLPDEITDAVKQQADWATRPGGVTPVVPPKTDFSQAMGNVAAKTEKSLTTPESVASLPFFELKAVRAAMLASQVAHTPQQVQQIADTFKNPKSTAQQKWESLGDAGMNLAMTAGLALSLKPADVRSQFTPEEAAKIAETKPSEPTPPSELAHNEPNQPEAVPAPAAPVASEPPKVTAEKLMKQETANAVKPADEVQDYFAPDVEQVPVKEPETPTAPIVDQPVNKTEIDKAAARVQGEVGGAGLQPVAGQKAAKADVPPAASGSTPELIPSRVPKSYDISAYLKAMDDASSRKLSQAKRDEALQKLTQLKKTFPDIHAEAIARRTARGVSSKRQLEQRFERESQEFGDDLLGWIKDQGGILSRTQARAKGKEWWAKNKSLYDDAPDKLSAPHHNQIYGGGQTPDQVAQAAYEAGKISEPTTTALWDAIHNASKERAGRSGQAGHQAKAMENELAQHQDWVDALKKGGEKVAVNDLREGETLEVDGESVKVTQVDPDTGEVVVQDGRRFERQVLNPDTSIYVEKYIPKEGDPDWTMEDDEPPAKAEEPAPPKLRPGEKVGDLLQGDDAPFNLSGEKASDGDRIAAEKAKAEQTKKEAAEIEGKQQTQMTGMGGAVPAEFEKPGTFVSNMFAAIDRDREQMGKPPMPETKARSWDVDNTKALAKMNAEPNWIPDLIQQVKQSPRPLLSWENAGMVWQRAKWKAEANNALARIAQAFDDGRQDDLREAEIHNAVLEDHIGELDEAVGRNGTGTEAGRTLNAQKMAAGDDFSLVEMRLKKRAANNGRRLTPAEEAVIAKQHSDFEAARKDYEEKLAAEKSARSKAEVELALERLKREPSLLPRIHPDIIKRAEAIRANIKTASNSARERLRAKRQAGLGGELGSGPFHIVNGELENIRDFALIGADHLADIVDEAGNKVAEFAAWAEKMKSEWGNEVIPHLEKIYDASRKVMLGQDKDGAVKKRNTVVKDAAEQTKEVLEQIGDKIKDGKANEISPQAQKLARLAVEQGAKGWRAVNDAVHAQLKDILPDWDYQDTMDAVSGYGKFSLPKADVISRELADAKSQTLEIRKIQEVIARQPVKPTGFKRAIPSDVKRRFTQIYEAMKRKFGLNVTNPEVQLRSALQARETYYRNRIADLKHEISTGKRTVKTKSPTPTSPKLEALQKELTEVQAEHKAIFGERKLTDQQKLSMAIKAAEKSEAEYTRRAQAGEFTKPSNTSLDSRELRAARAKRDAAKASFEELQALDEHFQQEQAADSLERQKTALEKSIAAKEAQIATGQVEQRGGQVNRPADPTLEPLKQKRDALNKQIAELRKPKRTPDERALLSYKTRLANSIEEFQGKLDRGDFSKSPRKELKLDTPAQTAKAKLEQIKLAIRRGFEKDRLANRPKWEKFMEQVSGAARASALSGYHTLIKLAGYDLAKFVETPGTEVVGGGLAKVPGLKPIFTKAHLESGPTLKAIGDFYTGAAIRGMKEAWNTLRRGDSQAKLLYGKPQIRPPQWFDFFGNLHMAEKTPLLTGTHEMYIRRLTVNAIKNGLDPANEFVRAAINKEAYEYSQKSILQENNKFAEAVSMLHTRLEKANPKTGQVDIANATISTLVKTFLTKGIVRTPANYFSQTIARTPAGLITGLVKAGMAHYRGIGNLHPIEANAISALLKTGAVGSAFFLLGMIDATKKPEDRTFGGYWEPGRKRDGKDVEWGKIRILGVTLPHLVTHNPLTEVAQMGTTTMRVAMSKFNKHDQETQGMAAGAVKALVGLAGKAPVASPLMRVGEARSNVAGDFLQGLVPQLLQNIAEDTDSEKRSPKTAIQSVEMGIPGLRQNVPKAKK